MEIKVKTCQTCPFANNDNEFGYDRCNLASTLQIVIPIGYFGELPEDKRHESCPIKDGVKIVVDK